MDSFTRQTPTHTFVYADPPYFTSNYTKNPDFSRWNQNKELHEKLWALMREWSQPEYNNLVVVSGYEGGDEEWKCMKEKENPKKAKPRRGLRNEKLFVWTNIDLLNIEGVVISSSDCASSSDSDGDSDADTNTNEDAAESEEDEEEDEEENEDLLDTSSLVDVSPPVSGSDSDASPAAVDVPVEDGVEEEEDGDEMEEDGEEGGEETCRICNESFLDTHYHTLECNHRIHDACFDQWAGINGDKTACPVCRAHVELEALRSEDEKIEDADDGECGEDESQSEAHASGEEFTTEHPDDAEQVDEEDEDEDGDYQQVDDGSDDSDSDGDAQVVRRSTRTRRPRNLQAEDTQVTDWMES